MRIPSTFPLSQPFRLYVSIPKNQISKTIAKCRKIQNISQHYTVYITGFTVTIHFSYLGTTVLFFTAPPSDPVVPVVVSSRQWSGITLGWKRRAPVPVSPDFALPFNVHPWEEGGYTQRVYASRIFLGSL